MNRCVKRNYDYDAYQQLSNNANLPLLKIPTLSAPKADANDWRARFQTVENTFAARIGQICNAALDRSVIAYSEAIAPEERKRYRRELETLAILSGLEIDAAKTGVRPNLDAERRRTEGEAYAFPPIQISGGAGGRATPCLVCADLSGETGVVLCWDRLGQGGVSGGAAALGRPTSWS